jgi:IclR family acetate operon transcriptional repressor
MTMTAASVAFILGIASSPVDGGNIFHIAGKRNRVVNYFRNVEMESPMLDVDTQRRKTRGRPRKSEESSASVQVLDRALALMGLIAGQDGITAADLAELAPLPASTVHRLLATLAAHGFVRQDAETGAWTVGVAAFTVGQAFVRVRRVESLGRPAMRALMEASAETVNLGVVEGPEVVFLAQVECHAPIRAFFRPGRRGPVHASGIGKAMLAHAEPAAVAALLGPGPLPAFTETTVTDPAALAAQLAATWARGWALDDEEHTLGMRCVAAPVFDHTGAAVAAVSVSGPSVRLTPPAIPRIAALTQAAAAAITSAIGGHRPETVS